MIYSIVRPTVLHSENCANSLNIVASVAILFCEYMCLCVCVLVMGARKKKTDSVTLTAENAKIHL